MQYSENVIIGVSLTIVGLFIWNIYPKWFLSPWFSIFALIIAVSYITMSAGVNTTAPTWIGKFVIVSGLIFVIVSFYTYFQPSTGMTALIHFSDESTAFKYIITILISIVALAFTQPIVSDNLKRMEGWSGFLANLIYALPCLLTDYIRYLLHEYASTSRVFVILLALEAGLIAAYLLVPRFVVSVRRRIDQGIPISRNVVFLRGKTEIPNTVHAQPTPYEMVPTMSKMSDKQLYSISLWLFITPVDIGEDDVSKYSIFRYGNNGNDASGKPSVHFAGSGKRQGNMLRIGLSDRAPATFTLVPMSSQRWNSMIFNYSDNGADVFINGELVHHESFSPEALPVYSPTDMFIMGNDSSVSLGAIQQVMYYDRPLSMDTIRSIASAPRNVV